jgi:hypothetical protein
VYPILQNQFKINVIDKINKNLVIKFTKFILREIALLINAIENKNDEIIK